MSFERNRDEPLSLSLYLSIFHFRDRVEGQVSPDDI